MSKHQERNWHAEIMNLPCNAFHAASPRQDLQDAYSEGHKRARHDAAELVNDFAAERDRLKEEKAELLKALERIITINGSTKGAQSLVDEFKHIARAAIAKVTAPD